MAIIINKFKYADASSLASINQSIATLTVQLNDATALYNQAMAAIAACNNSSNGCLNKTGRHISTWRDQRDRYYPLVTQYKAELKELLTIQASLAGIQQQSAVATSTVAAAQTAIVEAETAQTKASATKYLIFGAIGLALVIGGIIAYKLIRKK